jgi:tetratricopeptide (TPR) repeat protein
MTRAMADCDQVIKLNPKSTYAYNNRGATFQRMGDYARASADYGAATKLQPNNADARAARYWVRAAGGREVQQAINDCDQALKIKADQPDVRDIRGFVNLRLGKIDDAIKDYDAALKLDPKLAGALYGRGVAKMKKNDRAGGGADIASAKVCAPTSKRRTPAMASARNALPDFRLHPATANLNANSSARNSTIGLAWSNLPDTILITA